MARRSSVANMEREQVNLGTLGARLAHRPMCQIHVTRVKNQVQNAINMAHELLRSGRLHAVGEVELVTSVERLRQFVRQAFHNRAISFDLETTGLDIYNDIIVGLCLYTEGEKGIYVPVNHTDAENNRLSGQLTEEMVWDVLRPLCHDPSVRFITHNGKFDGKMFRQAWGGEIANFYWDTLVAGHLLNETEPHGLKELWARYVAHSSVPGDDYADLFGANMPFNYIPLEVATVYGGNDAIKTWQLWQFQAGFLNPEHPREDMRRLYRVLMEIEMPLYPVLLDVEMRGVQIRADYAAELAAEMRAELLEVEAALDVYVGQWAADIEAHPLLCRLAKGGKVNWSSPDQVAALFYEVWCLPAPRRKEPRSTDEEAMETHKRRALAKGNEKGKRFAEFVDNLLRLRFLKKMLSTYVEKIPKILEPKTNAVHSNFNQTGTVTGRFSSSHPITKMNLQNIPSHEKRIRKIFRARHGHKLVGGDFSQIEPRTLAALANDEAMIEAYRQRQDLYALMASRVYGLPIDQCRETNPDGSKSAEGKERRSSMKSVLLGIMYERGEAAIAEQFNKPIQWAAELVLNFKRAYPKIEQYRLQVIHHAETTGWVSTFDGRKRRLPEMMMQDHDDWKYQAAHRQALNAVIQGTAGDIMKRAMNALWRDEEFRALGGAILMTIHDELICEFRDAVAEQGAACMERVMKQVGEDLLGLPMSVDCEISDFWYENEAD